MMHKIKKISLVIVALIIAAFYGLQLYQNKMLYPAPNMPTIKSFPEHIEKISFASSYGYLLKPRVVTQQRFPLVIYLHGNGELIDMWVDKFDPLLAKGIAVFLLEYPGYGDAAGSPSLTSIKQAVAQGYDAVTKLSSIDKSQIVAYGRSMGGGGAGLLAEQRPLNALALESTFSSLGKLVQEYGYPQFILRDKYDTANIVKQFKQPVYIYHGKADNIIPFSHALTLKEAASDVTFHSDDCGHNNCPVIFGELIDFLQSKAGFTLLEH